MTELIPIAVIAAISENGVVGVNNELPWHLPDDLKYFKRVTLGKPVIMGRKTFQSIGRPLPGRTNIVITSDRYFDGKGAQVVSGVEVALELAREAAESAGQEEIMVIGGAALYSATIPLAQRLYITEIHTEVDGDAYFPEVEWSEWRESSREPHSKDDRHDYAFSFVVFERR